MTTTSRRPLLALFLREGSRIWHVALEPGRSLTLGRSSECDIVVKHPCLSRKHAILHVGERIVLEDLGSANGTFVADRRVEPGRIGIVELGEPLTFGTLVGSIAAERSSGVRLPRAWFGPRERAAGSRDSERPSVPSTPEGL